MEYKKNTLFFFVLIRFKKTKQKRKGSNSDEQVIYFRLSKINGDYISKITIESVNQKYTYLHIIMQNTQLTVLLNRKPLLIVFKVSK